MRVVPKTEVTSSAWKNNEGCRDDSHARPGSLARSESASWLVVKTQAHKEAIAVQSLQRLELKTYCPVVQKRVRHARRVCDVRRPLFPGYLFVEVASAERSLRPIHYAVGVSHLVRSGAGFAQVPGAVIEEIRAREVDGVIRKPARAFKAGEQVRVTSGPFENVVATVLEAKENQRVMVLLSCFGQSVRVSVPGELTIP